VWFSGDPGAFILMNPQLKYLIELQKVDSEIAELEKSQARIPKQIEAGKSDLQERQNRLKAAQDDITEVQKKRKDLELDVATENDHIAKTKTKLPLVKTNKEYTAILTEVDTIKEKISVLEDNELELMETLEAKEKVIPQLQALCKEEEDKFNAYKLKKEAEMARGEKELGVNRARSAEVARAIETKWLGQYQKVAKARDGLAVVGIQDTVCQGCYQQILPQQAIDVRIGETITQCQHCLRYLYWIEQSETAVPK